MHLRGQWDGHTHPEETWWLSRGAVDDATFFFSPGKNTEAWAKDLKLNDFELLCLDGTRKPVTEARSCHLAMAPNHAVVSRTDKVERLKQVLFDQQVWTTGLLVLS